MHSCQTKVDATALCCLPLLVAVSLYSCTFPLQKLDRKFGINMSYKSEISTITLFNNKINPILKFFNLGNREMQDEFGP